jgi:CBS domain-containing protein
MKVNEIMTQGIVMVDTETSVRDAAEIMRGSGIGTLLVRKGTVLEGILTDHDIVERIIAKRNDPDRIFVGETMSTGLVSCYEDQSIEEAVNLMKSQSVHHLVVLNHREEPVGILSAGDIITRVSLSVVQEKVPAGTR